MAKPIDLFGKFRKASRSSKKGGPMGLQFKIPNVFISVDEKKIAEGVTDALLDTIQANMLAGKRPDGRPLPAAHPNTVKRRQARVKQAQRGGGPPPRYGKDFSRDAKRAFKKRFPPKSQPTGTHGANRWAGIESGLLATSLRVRQFGGGWMITVSRKRASTIILARVFKKIGLLSKETLRQPKMQQALKRVLTGVVSNNKRKLLRSLKESVTRTAALLKEADEI